MLVRARPTDGIGARITRVHDSHLSVKRLDLWRDLDHLPPARNRAVDHADVVVCVTNRVPCLPEIRVELDAR